MWQLYFERCNLARSKQCQKYKLKNKLNIRQAYKDSLAREGYVRDPAQIELIGHLEILQRRLESHKPQRNKLFRLLSCHSRTNQYGINGLYIWGGVGRGKTFLMDLFFDSLNIKQKKRIHFHRMMHDIHERLRIIGDIKDPLDCVAKDIAKETRVLCFDEFFVSDIADAMILGRLLDGLFSRGVTLVATSNSKPNDLYKDGLQRDHFIPAISQLNLYTSVIELESDIDYRLRLLRQAGAYLTPNNKSAHQKLRFYFDESATSEIRENHSLMINGRQISALHCAKSIVWFDFFDLCDGPRNQSDYIEIARWYSSVIISDVPQFEAIHDDQARRFIALVDEFYDRRVKLIISSAVAAKNLYGGKRLTFEFERTISRLIEMQSTEYLALPHLA